LNKDIKLLLKSELTMPNHSLNKRRWAVEEIGKNSVIPSMAPKIKACHQAIKIKIKYKDIYIVKQFLLSAKLLTGSPRLDTIPI